MEGMVFSLEVVSLDRAPWEGPAPERGAAERAGLQHPGQLPAAPRPGQTPAPPAAASARRLGTGWVLGSAPRGLKSLASSTCAAYRGHSLRRSFLGRKTGLRGKGDSL